MKTNTTVATRLIKDKTADTRFIDGLRAASSIWVIVAHCMIWSSYSGLIPDPKIAVDVFIIISGYVITLNYRGNEHPLSFYTKRAFRLLPIYYFTLTLSFIFFDSLASGQAELQLLNPTRWIGSNHNPLHYVADAKSFIAHISMLFGLSPMYSIGTFLPDWSLSLECQFYLCLPLLLPIILRRPVLIAIISTTISWAWIIAAKHICYEQKIFGLALPEPSALPIKLPIFLIGILCCEYRRDPRKIHIKWIAAMLAISQTVFAAAFIYGLQSVAFLFLAFMFFSEDRMNVSMRQIFGARIFKFFANTSYSAYLMHNFFIVLFGHWILAQHSTGSSQLDFIALAIAVLGSTYVTSAILYKLIEQPMTQLGKRIAEKSSALQRQQSVT